MLIIWQYVLSELCKHDLQACRGVELIFLGYRNLER